MRRTTPGVRSAGRRSRGAVVAEFAIVLPILMVLLLGIVELGRAVMVRQALTDAARAGCRQAILQSTSKADVLVTIASTLTPVGVADYAVTFAPDPPALADSFEAVTVTVGVPYADVAWGFTPNYFESVVLTGTATMAKE